MDKRIQLQSDDIKRLEKRYFEDGHARTLIYRIDDIVDLIFANRALRCDIHAMRSLVRQFSEEANAWLDQVCEMSGTPLDEPQSDGFSRWSRYHRGSSPQP